VDDRHLRFAFFLCTVCYVSPSGSSRLHRGGPFNV